MTLTDTGTQIRPLDVPDELATAEATDVTLIGEAMETVDVGPFLGRYFRVAAGDLLVAIAEARRLLAMAEDAVLEARQERMEAERSECYCGTLLDPEELTCGAERCNRLAALDADGLVP